MSEDMSFLWLKELFVDTQRSDLNSIVTTRQSIATELRKFMTEQSPDSPAITAKVLALSTTYGELDGSIVYNYVKNFAIVGKSLTMTQKTTLSAMRTKLIGSLAPTGAYLYSAAIAMPTIENTDGLFSDTQ